MPKLAPVIQRLINEMEDQKNKQSPDQRQLEQNKITERIKYVILGYSVLMIILTYYDFAQSNHAREDVGFRISL